MPTAISASEYQVELRDKDGNLKTYLTPWVTKINWEWNRIGGCGRCSMTIGGKGYRDIIFDARDDIQIRVESGATSKLAYRGFIANITPTLKVGQEITLDVRGYFDILKKIVIQDGGDTLTYPKQKLLIHFDGADGATSHTAATGQAVTFAGNAQLDTAQKKFGTASCLFDGTDDYCTVPDSADWEFGSFDFTIDFQIRFAAFPANPSTPAGIIAQYGDANNQWGIQISDAKLIKFFFIADGVTLADYSYSWSAAKVDPWYHVEIVRSGTTMKLFIDGTEKTLTETTAISTKTLTNIAGTVMMGSESGGTSYFLNGWLDEVRICGTAMHTASFTAPSAAYDLETLSTIIGNIADTFITPNSPITKGTIDVNTFDSDAIGFLCTVEDALRTLADLAGDAEYGVDEDRVFYWRTENTTITHKFFVGDNITVLERRVSYDDLVNKIYLIGGEVDGVKFKTTGEDTDSQTKYYLSEEIVNNSSITTDAVATQYLNNILSEKSSPKLNIRAQIKNTDIRIEDTIPLGAVSFYDATYDSGSLGDSTGDIIGEAADGGSDIIIGETGDGGSDVTIGGYFSGQVDRISYTLSNTPGRFNIEIQLGDAVLETAAKIKRLELALSSLQQGG